MKNNFAPISKIPSDVFSLIPGYFTGRDVDENLITMTHVCRGWRELLIAHSSLWARLDCKNADKTRVYIERSKSAPLDLILFEFRDTTYLEDAFLSVIPYISRLKSLTIVGAMDLLQNLTPHISCPLPLLRELEIHLTCDPAPGFDNALFNGDFPSLCSLHLAGSITYLPWNNLSKLTTFKLSSVSEGKISITQLLDFFEDAHHLRDITLNESIPTLSDAPPGRVVSLPCLESLVIDSDVVHSILLNHLSIPAGASLIQEFAFQGDKSPLLDFLPKTLDNLGNILTITSVNLCLDDAEKHVKLGGPSGRLYIHDHWMNQDEGASLIQLDRRILRSLSCFVLSGTQRLAVTTYNNLPFILALDPIQNPSKHAPCPELKELILYVKDLKSFNIKELTSMTKERASAGRKLSLITFVGLGELVPGEKVFKLKEYVTRVDYKVGEKPPRWDVAPGDRDD